MVAATVKISVGGTLFTSTAATLTSGSSFFARLLDSDGGFSDFDETGVVFIDRDPTYFGIVLQFLRCGLVEVPLPLSLEGALAEAEFFLCEQLAAELRERIAARDAPQPPQPPPSIDLLETGGVYVREDPSDPAATEAIRFVATARDEMMVATGEQLPADALATGGTVVYSRGPAAAHNVLAIDAMMSPLPRLWREHVAARTLIARFTQSFIARGTFRREGSALLITCGELFSAADAPAQQQLLVGIALAGGVLLVITEARQAASLASNFGLTPVDPHTALNGGFRRFQFRAT